MSGRLRSALEILACVSAACAAQPTTVERSGFDVAGRSYAVATPAPAIGREPAIVSAERDAPAHVAEAAAATRDLAADEKFLREEFAAQRDPVEPALDLAGFLCGGERYPEALMVIDQARQRSPDPRLRIARAGLLRDLGRRPDAARELRSLVHERGADDLHPSLLLEWAEIEWIDADFAAARAALAELSRVHGQDPWCSDHRDAIATIGRAVAREQRAAKGVRDLLGDLRGNEAVAVRLAALDGAMTTARLLGPDEAPELVEQVMSIALGDDDEAVRARAVTTVDASAAIAPAVLAAALADEAPVVRAAAADRAMDLDRRDGMATLLGRLSIENDPTVFLQLHRSLAAAVGESPPLPADGGASSTSRAALVAAWRERCSQ